MRAEVDGVVLDYSRQNMTLETLGLLGDLADTADLGKRIEGLYDGSILNVTEGRSVLHTALRAPKDTTLEVEGKNVIPDVHKVLAKSVVLATKYVRVNTLVPPVRQSLTSLPSALAVVISARNLFTNLCEMIPNAPRQPKEDVCVFLPMLILLMSHGPRRS